jgi:nucleotide-binding universal stress UspA family protein
MSAKENIILVPTDFKEQSLIALSQSYNLARFTHSKIHLMHVVDKGDDSNAGEEKLNQLAKEVHQKTNIEVKTFIAQGNPFVEVNKAIERLEPILVFVGLNSDISSKSFLGQNSFRMVRESITPVITIKGKAHRDGCKTILLPLDLTKETREKVGKAIEFAKYFGSKIQLLSVLDKGQEVYENKLLSYSNQVKRFIQEKGVACGNKTVRGKNIAELIVNHAKDIDADLIMIMTKAEINLKEFFIGTTAQHLINISPIPVLSIRPMIRKDTSTFASPY